jgi:uncharacterized protein
MRHLRALGLAVVLCAAAPAAGFAQEPSIDPAIRADVEKLIELMGGARLGHQMASAMSSHMLESLRRSNPNVPERVTTIAKEVIEEELSKAFDGSGGLMGQLVPIYARHFTHDEILGMIAFYQSDLGRHVIAEMPGVMQESMAAGQRWGEEIGPRVQAAMAERLKAEGIVK